MINQIDDLYSELIGPDSISYHGSQNKSEFCECIDHIYRCINLIHASEIWFLEIGAYKGLWALAFKVLCEAADKIPRYVTVTWVEHDPNNKDLYRVKEFYEDNGQFFKLIDADSTDEDTLKKVLNIGGNYNFVLIDGDHSYKSVMTDIRQYAPLATHRLIFHDINTADCGVRKAIDKSEIHLNIQISYGNIMGIGLVDKTFTGSIPRRKRFWM